MKNVNKINTTLFGAVFLAFFGFNSIAQSTFKSIIGSFKGENVKLFHLSGNDFLIAGSTSYIGNTTGDCFVARLNDSMRVKWVRYLGVTTYNDIATSAHLMPNGNFRITGTRVLSTASSDLGSIYIDLNPATGTIVSATRWGNSAAYSSNYLCYSIKTLDGGQLYFGAPEGGMPQTGQNKMAIVKFNSNMTVEWARYIYHTTSGAPYSNTYEVSSAPTAVQLADSSFVIGGTLAFFSSAAPSRPRVVNVSKTGNSTIFISDIYNNFAESITKVQAAVNNNGIMVASSGNGFGYLTKLNLAGALVWSKRYGTSSSNNISISTIERTNDNKYIIAGATTGFGTANDACILKLDTSGNVIWAKRYTTTGSDDESFNTIYRIGNNYYVGGTFDSSGTNSYLHGNTDALVLKIDTNGFFCDTFSNFKIYDFTSQVSVVARTPTITSASYTVPTFTYSPVNDNPYQTGNIILKTDPNCTVNLGPNKTLCKNDSVILSVNRPCASILWSNSSTASQITIKTQGTYWVQVKQAFCDATDTIDIYLDTATVSINAGVDDTICSTESASLQATAVNATSINWTSTGTGNFSNSHTLSTIYYPSTTDMMAGSIYLICNAIRIISACTTSVSDTLKLIILSSPPSPQLSSNGDRCSGDTIKLFASNIANATYYWSGPNNFYSNLQNPIIPNISPADSGYYSCRVKVGDCMSYKDSIKIRVFPIPNAPSLSYHMPACEGDTLKLFASAANNADYYWTGPGNFASTLQNPLKTNISLADSGEYYCYVSISGCYSTPDTLVVIITPKPSPPFIYSNSPVCESDTLKLFANNINGANYFWHGPGNFNATTQNHYKIKASLGDSGIYTCCVSVLGCKSDYDSIRVKINPSPSSANPSGNSPICAGETIKLRSDSVVDASYFWTGPKGYSSIKRNNDIANATSKDSGYYFLTVSVQGCMSKKDSVLVSIIPLPQAPIINSNSPVCEGDTLKLHSNQYPGATYLWNGPNGFSNSLREPVFYPFYPKDTGIYYCRMIINGCIGNASMLTAKVLLKPQPPVLSSNSPICAYDSVLRFFASSVSGASYFWTGPSGFISAVQNPFLTHPSVGHSGYYYCKISVNGCYSKKDSVNIIVLEKPRTIQISSNSPVCEGDTLLLSATNENDVVYHWTGPNNFTSNLKMLIFPSAGLKDSGYYSCRLSKGICFGYKDSIFVRIKPLPVPPNVTNNGPVCEGELLKLSASIISNATYHWSGPYAFHSSDQNPVVDSFAKLHQKGTYSVSVVVDGCISSNSTTSVIVHAKPNKPTISKFGNALVSSSARSYQWYLDGNLLNGASLRTYTPTQNGYYTVTINDSNGCSNTSDPYYMSVIGMEENSETEEFSVYPNPSYETVIFNFPINTNKIEITNSIGVTVYSGTLKGIKSITLHFNSGGLFYAKIITSAGILTKSFVIVK